MTCACGCGETPKGEGRRFLSGHNSRVLNDAELERRRKIGESMRGENHPMFGKTGEDSPVYKGRGQYADGTVWIKMPEHPNANSLGRVPEHRLVAEEALGRPLEYEFGDPNSEVVHHVNFDPSVNRSGNLLVCTEAYHRWLHAEIRRRGLEEYFKSLQLKEA